MRHLQIVFRLLCVTLAVIVMGACSGEDCPINNTVLGKMAFYNAYGDAVAINGELTVSVVRQQGDTVVLNRKNNASEVLFPLSYAYEKDTLIFCYVINGNWVLYDSIYVSHENIPTLVSVDCGTAMFHTITSVSSTHNVIDTLVLTSSKVNYDEHENIQVIYRTAD